MSHKNFHSLATVKCGSYEWNVKVRIVRLWRGREKNGEEFKGFNLLLLDDKRVRIHAFVPGAVAETNEKKLEIGKIHTISNFSVKEYKQDDKFRCVRSQKQILFTSYTEVIPLDEEDIMIPNNVFDFYDLGDLENIANDNTYLTDVIGILEKDMPLRRLINKHGISQSQLKFNIYDGRCTKTVTFWDRLAEQFETDLMNAKQFPPIIIIASAKITSWKGTTNETNIDIGNVTATTFYINYDHHSVAQMRKMFSTPSFSNHDFSSQIPEQFDVLLIQQIKEAGNEYVKKEVICEFKICSVDDTDEWFLHVCTSCFAETYFIEGEFKCKTCFRTVPYPDKKFRIFVQAEDHSGNIQLQIDDREVSTFIGTNVFDILEKEEDSNTFPVILKSFEQRCFTAKLLIRPLNVSQKLHVYTVTDMYAMPGHRQEVTENETELSNTMTPDSTSTYHLSGLSQLNFQSPDISKCKRVRKPNKKYPET